MGNLAKKALQELLDAFDEFLRVDVAAGDPTQDTIKAYHSRVRTWVQWCQSEGLNPARATLQDVKAYRATLVEAGYKPNSIASKLSAIKRLYDAALAAGIRPENPAAGVKPPRDRRAAEDVRFLSEGQLELLVRAIPKAGGIKALRDRALLGLMALQALRTVEVQRASVQDLRHHSQAVGLMVRGKNQDRLIYLRPDVWDALCAYLHARGDVHHDELGQPLICAVGNRAGGKRIGRRGIRHTVDHYLRIAQVKRPGLSNHALRHTAATLAYRHGRDLRAVQEMLGHRSPEQTSRYAQIVDKVRSNAALNVPVSLD